MKFPNAAQGVKKIFTAEILAIIAAGCTLIGGIMIVIAAASAGGGSKGGAVAGLAGTAIFMIAAAIISLISFIMNIIGINNASKDEPSFKTAFYCVLVGIVASIVAGIFSGNSVVNAIFTLVGNISSLAVTVFVITGIIKLADQLNNGEVSAKGNNQLKLIVAIYALSIIASLIVMILGGYSASVVAAVIYVIAMILNVIQIILYLSFLNKAKQMLAE